VSYEGAEVHAAPGQTGTATRHVRCKNAAPSSLRAPDSDFLRRWSDVSYFMGCIEAIGENTGEKMCVQ